VNASPKAWAIALAASSVGCFAFVVATLVAKGTDSNNWGTTLNTLWITALIGAVIASLTAPIAALQPARTRPRVACSLPALLFVALLLYLVAVVAPSIA
jgi:hypothetical protein